MLTCIMYSTGDPMFNKADEKKDAVEQGVSGVNEDVCFGGSATICTHRPG